MGAAVKRKHMRRLICICICICLGDDLVIGCTWFHNDFHWVALAAAEFALGHAHVSSSHVVVESDQRHGVVGD